MNFKAFLRDRRPYIVVYAVANLLIATVFQLERMIAQRTADFSTFVYALVFSLLGLIIFLAIDYRRQIPFYRQFTALWNHDSPSRFAVLQQPITWEQHLFADAWERLYATANEQLLAERRRGEQRLHLFSQWVHHMKTPVAVIDLELQKAAQRPSASLAPTVADSIAEENARLNELIQTMLNVIRLDDFTRDFRVEQVPLLPLVRQTINDRRREFIAYRVYPKIHPSLTDANVHVTTDAKWLTFVLEQILSNAVKYASRDDAQGQVRIGVDTAAGQTVLFIEDNGMGIPPEDLGRVLQPFFTGSTGRKHRQSTGMGLYLAHEACQKLGHELTIKSTVGTGTRVNIRFLPDATVFAGLPHTGNLPE